VPSQGRDGVEGPATGARSRAASSDVAPDGGAPSSGDEPSAGGTAPPSPSARHRERGRDAAAGQPIVGRGRELDALERVLAAAARGDGQVVLVAGEAGIGKTTLVSCAAERAAAAGAIVVRGHCSDVGRSPPFAPWLEALAGRPPAAGTAAPNHDPEPPPFAAAASQEELLDGVLSRLRALGAGASPLLVVLEDLHWADAESIDLLRWVSGQVGSLPVAVVATYREGDGRAHDRLATVLAHLVRESGAVRLALEPWTAAQVGELVAARFGDSWPHREALSAYLERYGDGNPLLVRELVRGLEQERRLVETPSGWSLDDLANLRGAPLPMMLRAALQGRLAACGETTRAAVEVAAVLGHELAYEDWRAVLDAADDEMVATVDECLDGGVLEEVDRGRRLRFRHALLRESLYYDLSLPRRKVLHRAVAAALAAARHADPGIVAHHLEQSGDAAAVEWWVEAARRAAASFARATAADAFHSAARLLAADAGRRAERGWYLLAAASNAREAQESPEAWYEEAAAIAARLGDPVLGVEVRWSRGLTRCYRGRNGLDDMSTALAEWQELAGERRRYPARLAGLAQPVEPGLLAFWCAVFGRYEEALRWAAAQASAAGGGFAGGFALAARACVLAATGRPAEAEGAFERTRAGFRALGHRWGEAVHTWIEYVMLTVPYQAEQPGRRWRMEERVGALWRGSIQAATRLPGELGLFPAWFHAGEWDAIASWEARGEPAVTYEYAPRAALGRVMRLRGSADEAWRQVHLCLPAGPATSPDGVMVLEGLELRRLAAELALDGGDLALAAEWIDSFSRAVALGDRVLGRAEEALLRAELARAAGEREESRGHALRAQRYAGDPLQSLALAAAGRALGRLALERGDLEEARALLDDAQRLWEATGVRHETAVTQVARAELLLALGEQGAAAELLEEAGGVLAKLGAALLLRGLERVRARFPVADRARADAGDRAGAAGAGAGAAPGAGAGAGAGASGSAEDRASRARIGSADRPPPAGLTPRERSVLALVARGASNRDIAEALVISVRTVERHVANIYAKTGATNRATATAFALRHGIE